MGDLNTKLAIWEKTGATDLQECVQEIRRLRARLEHVQRDFNRLNAEETALCAAARALVAALPKCHPRGSWVCNEPATLTILGGISCAKHADVASELSYAVPLRALKAALDRSQAPTTEEGRAK
jgi:hypothetical protein